MLTNTNMADMKRGYIFDNDCFTCLICGRQYEKGEIFKFADRLVDAQKAVQLHIEETHGSVFQTLIAADKKNTGLSDGQRKYIKYFYSGASDKEIAGKLKLSPSTIRFQRHNLREKAKQARAFLVLFELMEEKMSSCDIVQPIHNGATMVDERYMVTDNEVQKIIKDYFSSVDPLILLRFPTKEKKKIVVLREIVKQFHHGIKYSEKQINEILKTIFEDFVTLRRYLIEYGFMDRTRDCKEYWLK